MKGMMLRYIAHKTGAAAGAAKSDSLPDPTPAASDVTSSAAPVNKKRTAAAAGAGSASDDDSLEQRAILKNSYGEAEYWNARYSRTSGFFDWYVDYDALWPALSKYMSGPAGSAGGGSGDAKSKSPAQSPAAVLHVGCGNSQLSEELYDAGFRRVTNIDISDILITGLRAHYQLTPYRHTTNDPTADSDGRTITPVIYAAPNQIIIPHPNPSAATSSSSAAASSATVAAAATANGGLSTTPPPVTAPLLRSLTVTAADIHRHVTQNIPLPTFVAPPAAAVAAAPVNHNPFAAASPDAAVGGMRYLTVDARAMPFESKSFDYIIDKGTIDAVVCEDNSDVGLVLSECARLLAIGGTYILITYGSPRVRLPLLQHPALGWTVQHHIVPYSASALVIRKLRHGLKGRSLSAVSKQQMLVAAAEVKSLLTRIEANASGKADPDPTAPPLPDNENPDTAYGCFMYACTKTRDTELMQYWKTGGKSDTATVTATTTATATAVAAAAATAATATAAANPSACK